MYLKQYYRARKAQNPEYYNLHSLRKYYRKQLKSVDDNDVERKTKILSKLETLDEQLKAIKDSRNKYTRWQGNRSKSPSDAAALAGDACSPGRACHFYEAADAAA